ncbi:adenylosuccinate lyase [Actomonas aquatica]|uniref:Adenylosuccinate lyase n=1 Tax=Actomonas aquatica TaxID=2866162 RepID=A0ABZ1C419_9BACT|nr:adenylosuccinate lyase [Opitutus sp. WL0086]WRQ86457.1 adenylosuccinate lyase [Opitutus sp. WL0086]
MSKSQAKKSAPASSSSSAPAITNVLAERYASSAIKAIWSPTGRVGIERDYWIAIMKAQRDLGIDIPAKAIASYEKVKDQIDLASIDARERVTLHDVKARIEEFNGLAGYETIHLGLTSRDLTENVEQLQIHRSLAVIRQKAAAALLGYAKRAKQFRNLLLTGRTHNVPAQPTTLGKRIAMFGGEMLAAFTHLDELAARYPARGLKGAVGTQLDQFTLLGGDAKKVARLEAKVLKHLGFSAALNAVGQVYPRSLDFEVVSALHQVGAAAASFATTLRLMAGQGLLTEGFQKGQVGSSAMPHKMNARNCERICGFSTILSGYVAMTGALAGDQWNEGDVSCSVVRRVALPDAFYAIDGLLETLLNVLNQMTVFPKVIAAESARNLPFLATTTIMMAAVKQGAGRETAHAAIKEHALAAAAAIREGREPGMVERLAADERLGLKEATIYNILQDTERFVGAAPAQVDTFVETARATARRVKGASQIKPGKLL